ncbi:unnamed protein product [Clavelina lepadiformis]|uniref:Toll-like receptor 3 n=1 Tax=Clavelina lepadiformis TaxID=159417 RepID=A0ABP0GVF8_CLALP
MFELGMAYKNFLMCIIIFVFCQRLGHTKKGQRIAYNCWLYTEEMILECFLARLDITLLQLKVPPNTTNISCMHSQLDNANLFQSHILQSAASIEFVNLAYNELTELPEEFFKSNRNLTEINLRNNKLATVPRNLFQFLKELRLIDLSNNFLTSLSGDTFAMNPKLQIVELWKNQLQFVSEELFRLLN